MRVEGPNIPADTKYLAGSAALEALQDTSTSMQLELFPCGRLVPFPNERQYERRYALVAYSVLLRVLQGS